MLRITTYITIFVTGFIFTTAADATSGYVLPAQITCVANGSSVVCTPALDSHFIKVTTPTVAPGTYSLNMVSAIPYGSGVFSTWIISGNYQNSNSTINFTGANVLIAPASSGGWINYSSGDVCYSSCGLISNK